MAEEIINHWPLLLPLFFLGGIAGGATGFGVYLVIAPALWIIGTPTEAIALAVMARFPGYFLLFRLRQSIVWERVGKLLAWSVPGLALGAFIHFALPSIYLQVGAGIAIIAIVLVRLAWERGIPIAVAGPFSGVLSTSVGFNGPPVSLSMHGLPERQQRASTLMALFVLGIMITLTFLLFGHSAGVFSGSLLSGLLILPPLALGFWAGHRLAERLGAKIETIAIAISVLGAAVMIAPAII